MVRVNLGQLQTALGMLTRFPLGSGRDSARGGISAVAVVLAAGLIGLGAALAAWLCRWLAGDTGGALLAGLLVGPLLWWLTNLRGLQALLAVAQTGRDAGGRIDDFFLRFAGFQALLLVKLLCIGLLVKAGASLWLAVAWLVVGAVFADELLAGKGGSATGTRHWLVATVGAVLLGGLLGQFMGALLVAVVAWLAAPGARRWLAGRVDLRGASFAWLFAETAETAVLFVATLIAFAR